MLNHRTLIILCPSGRFFNWEADFFVCSWLANLQLSAILCTSPFASHRHRQWLIWLRLWRKRWRRPQWHMEMWTPTIGNSEYWMDKFTQQQWDCDNVARNAHAKSFSSQFRCGGSHGILTDLQMRIWFLKPRALSILLVKALSCYLLLINLLILHRIIAFSCRESLHFISQRKYFLSNRTAPVRWFVFLVKFLLEAWVGPEAERKEAQGPGEEKGSRGEAESTKPLPPGLQTGWKFSSINTKGLNKLTRK